jgi:hypothetical protein
LNDVTRIISDLERQRTAIDRAISALREVAGRGLGNTMSPSTPEPATGGAPATKKKRQLSPEGRQRIIDAAKKRWAAKRAALKRQARAANATKT